MASLEETPILIQDKQGNQLLDLILLKEADLSKVAPLTHALVVARRGGTKKLLVLNRHRRRWELAGGMIDPGETPRSCAIRELHEESGIVCVTDDLRFVGAIKVLLQPSRFHANAHVEYGALYKMEVDQAAQFVGNEEIVMTCWWDGCEAIGEISPIDQKLTELAWPVSALV